MSGAEDPAYIKRYLQYSIASDDVEDLRVQNIVEVAGQGGDITAQLTHMQMGKQLERFLEKVRRYSNSLDEDGRFQLIRQLAQHTYRQTTSDATSLAFRDAAMDVLEDHVVRTPAGTRWKLLERVLKALPEWWMQANFFKAASTLFARYERAKEQVTSTAHEWMAGVLRAHTAELFSNSWVNPVSALLLIADQHGQEVTQPLVLQYIRESPAQKEAWLLTLARQSYGSRGPVPSEFGLDQYLQLDKVIDVNVMLPEVALDPPKDPLSVTDEAIAWAMFRRLEELHADAQEILRRHRAAEAGPEDNPETDPED